MVEVQQRVLRSAAVLAAAVLLVPSPVGARKFYDDDPLLHVPRPLPVKDPYRRRASEVYDYLKNTFGKPGEKQLPGALIRAKDINTIDEVPDGPWYTNRHGKRRMSIEEMLRGPNYSPPPSPDGNWQVTDAKTEGVTPGFTIRDSKGKRFQVKFDPETVRELGTGADVMGSKFFYAFGYWTPQNYLVYFPLEKLQVTPGTKFTDKRGEERELRQEDIDDVMKIVPRDEQGRFRAVASAYLPGKPLGPFKYHAVRRDDPNDIYPHEHMRVLRGLYVFASWINHTDVKALQSLDTLMEQDGIPYIRHNLIDFSATFGAEAFEPKSPRSGYVYLFDWKNSARSFFSFGLVPAAWELAHYDHVRGVGRLESKVFDPEKWKPNYYSPSFDNLLPDDAFWAAKTVMRFTEPEIRALVETSEYSDKEGLNYLVQVLLERQKKIGQTWFSKVLPLDNFRVEQGRLAFDDLAAQYGVGPVRQYTVVWSEFNNDTEKLTPLAGQTGPGLPRGNAPYVAAVISAGQPDMTVTVYLRRRGAEMRVVGVERTWPKEVLTSRLHE